MKIPREILLKIRAQLEGTCDQIDDALARLGLDYDPEDVEAELPTVNLDRCYRCGWWERVYTMDDFGPLCADCASEISEGTILATIERL